MERGSVLRGPLGADLPGLAGESPKFDALEIRCKRYLAVINRSHCGHQTIEIGEREIGCSRSIVRNRHQVTQHNSLYVCRLSQRPKGLWQSDDFGKGVPVCRRAECGVEHE